MPVITNCTARFAYNNYINIPSVTLNSPTEDATYPFTNAKDDFRTRFWRLGGRFSIDATNNKIYFNDGSPRTGTIVISEYSTGASLATAIQTAMNAVSSGYTVTYSSLKFTISHASSFTLNISTTTTAIWESIGFITGVDQSGTSHTSDESRRHYPYEYINLDLGANAQVSFMAMVSDPTNDFPISNQAEIRIVANNVNDFASPALNRLVYHTDRDRGVFHWIIDEDSNYRYWQIRIADTYNPSELDIGHIYFGNSEGFASTNVSGFNRSFTDFSQLSEAEDGTQYADTRPSLTNIGNISINLASTEDVDKIFDIYKKVGKHTPFFFSIDPGGIISTRVSDLTHFVFFNGEPSIDHNFYNRYNISLSLREAI